MLFPGSLYILGNISPYITSYYQLEDTTKASEILPTILALNVFIMPIGTILVQRNVSPKKMIFAGGCIAFALLVGATFFQHSFPIFFIMYSLAFAVN